MTLVAYAAVYLIWGSTYLAIRIAVGDIPPLLLMGVRCTAAGALMLAWAAMRGERAAPRQWRHAAIAGGLMIAGTYGALAWAEQRLASGIAALLSATSPLWLTTLDWPRSGPPAATTLAGLALGLAGVGALVASGSLMGVNVPADVARSPPRPLLRRRRRSGDCRQALARQEPAGPGFARRIVPEEKRNPPGEAGGFLGPPASQQGTRPVRDDDPDDPQNRRLLMMLAFAAVYLIWGSTYLAIRVGVRSLPPFLLSGVRFVSAGGLLYGLLRARGTPAPTRAEWAHAAIAGLLMLTAGNGLVTWA